MFIDRQQSLDERKWVTNPIVFDGIFIYYNLFVILY
jgi:hypothetical protein